MTNKEFDILLDGICSSYKGQGDKLTNAFGSLVVAHKMGWRVLFMLTSEPTIRKHEKILGLKFRDCFEERGQYAYRSLGLKISDKLSDFWNIVQGRNKINKLDKFLLE